MKNISKLQIFILISFFQFCTQNSEQIIFLPDKNANNGAYDTSAFATIISNSIISTNYKGHEYPICFEAAFTDSTIIKEITNKGESKYSFETVDIGKIKIESGKIIACDPIVMHDSKAFKRLFPKGEFDVEISVTKRQKEQYRTVAFARIIFSKNPVVKWIYAVLPGEVEAAVNDSSSFCYGVDAGTGIFIDEESRNILLKKGETEWNKAFMTKDYLKKDYCGKIYKFEDYNLATFNTGYGDGCYTTHIGLDKENKICRLLTDFRILLWWENEKK